MTTTPTGRLRRAIRQAIISTTPLAHVVTSPTNAINGAKHIATFPAAAGSEIEMIAYNGAWYTGDNGTTLT